MKWINGYTSRWIKFGGKRGFISLHLFWDGHRLLLLGPVAFHHFNKRLHRYLLPWRSRITGSIFWLRFCLGYRGKQ
jgi:hypothetical protein